MDENKEITENTLIGNNAADTIQPSAEAVEAVNEAAAGTAQAANGADAGTAQTANGAAAGTAQAAYVFPQGIPQQFVYTGEQPYPYAVAPVRGYGYPGIAFAPVQYIQAPTPDKSFVQLDPTDTRYEAYAAISSAGGNTPFAAAEPSDTASNAAGSSNPFENTQPVKTKKTRKHHMPKFLKVIGAALLFGVVASGVFLGSNYLYSRLRPNDSSTVSVVPSEKNTGSKTKVSLVESTPIISNVSSTATDVSGVVEAVMPSIVSIDCTFDAMGFWGPYQASGAGSGIILRQTDSELLIATNNHVVSNASSINVTFCNGESVSAFAKGTDATADLAVLGISLEDIPDSILKEIKVATLGDSDSIKVGQMVVAIGNALGYGQSTTVGYVSAKDREVTVDNNIMTLLQTDAAINPGNSGGALLNLKGEVIGINSVKYADSSVEGMGFAIPISRATAILDELASKEFLKEEEKGYLGIYMRDISSSMAEDYNMPMGAYVSEFVPGSPAETAGLQIGDIVTAVNTTKVLTATDLRNAVTSYRKGTTVTLTVMRIIDGSYTELKIDVVLVSSADLNE